MARHRGPVLVDTNVIIECWRVRAWGALAGGYHVETVEECVIETQTGFQRRRPEQLIDKGKLLGSLTAVHDVSDELRAAAAVSEPLFAVLDAGERDLWAHALSRSDDAWVLCGPDKASLRFGIRCGFRDQLVSLERLLKEAGHKPTNLKLAYTTKWLDKVVGELVLSEMERKK